MKGAIFFSGKYGSTKQYAHWISEATGLPVFDIKDSRMDLSKFDYLVLGSSVQFYKLTNRKWVKKNIQHLKTKSKILFTVSGAEGGPKLDRWVAKSIPGHLLSKMDHVALQGRLDHSQLSWGLRQIMRIGALLNPDPDASKDERYGFDYVDKSSIAPIVQLIKKIQASADSK
jgi:menaquinone-dependent protoporphyrinogen IX oxidase